MIETEVLICHPYKHHVYHYVRGVAKSGRGYRLVCPLYLKERFLAFRRFPVIGKRLSGYRLASLPDENVYVPLHGFFWRMINLAVSDIDFERRFDRYVAQQISRGKFKAKIFVSLQDYMPESVAAAVKQGMQIYSDQISNQGEEASGRINRELFSHGVELASVKSQAANNKVVSQAALITSPSNYCIAGVRKYISPSCEIVIAPYGASSQFDNEPKNYQGNHFVILARANTIRKGGHLLLGALAKLKLPVTLEVRVLGRFDSVLEECFREIKLPKNISLTHQNYAHSDVPDLLREADFFVMPALSEGMSLVCVEAMRSSLPIISSKYCGVDELLSGDAGPVFDTTERELICVLEEFFAKSEEWSKYSMQARIKGQSLTWSNYESLICKAFSK